MLKQSCLYKMYIYFFFLRIRMCAFSRMYDHFFTILSKADQLEELSIGCLDDVAKDSNKFLQLIASHHSKSIRVLGIASLKYDPEEYIHQSLDYHYLNYFSNLQVYTVSLNG